MEREPSDDSDLEVNEPTEQSSDHQQEDQPKDIDDLLGNRPDVTGYHDNIDDDKDKPKKTRKKKSHKKKLSQPEEPPLISFDDEVVATPPSAPPPSQSTGGYGSTGGTVVNPNANQPNLLDDWSSEDWGTSWDSQPTKREKNPSNGEGLDGASGEKSGGRDGGVKSGGWESEDWSDWGNEWNSVDLKAN